MHKLIHQRILGSIIETQINTHFTQFLMISVSALNIFCIKTEPYYVSVKRLFFPTSVRKSIVF